MQLLGREEGGGEENNALGVSSYYNALQKYVYTAIPSKHYQLAISAVPNKITCRMRILPGLTAKAAIRLPLLKLHHQNVFSIDAEASRISSAAFSYQSRWKIQSAPRTPP